jgi:hypothetical protein
MEAEPRPASTAETLERLMDEVLPSLLSQGAAPRALGAAGPFPEEQYVDPDWPAEEARLLRRYAVLADLYAAIAPYDRMAPFNSTLLERVAGAVDPMTGRTAIDPRAADEARRAYTAFNTGRAREVLARSLVDYARSIEADARDAVARSYDRFAAVEARRQAAAAAASLAVPAAVAGVPAVRAQIPAPATAPPRAIARPLRRPAAPRLSPLGARPRGPVWTPRPTLPTLAERQVEERRTAEEEEEEEEEPIIKRRRVQRAAPVVSPGLPRTVLGAWTLPVNISAASLGAPPSPPGTLPEEEEEEEVEDEEVSPQGLGGGGGGAAGPTRPLPTEPFDAAVGVEALARPLTVVMPTTIADIEAEARAVGERARAIEEGRATSGSEDDVVALRERQGYLESWAAIERASAAAVPPGVGPSVAAILARRAPPPMNGVYWYRAIARGGLMGEPGLLGPEGAGLHGPYLDEEGAQAAAIDEDSPDGAAADAALAWATAVAATGAWDEGAGHAPTMRTIVFRLQRPTADSRAVPPALRQREDTEVERWVTAVVIDPFGGPLLDASTDPRAAPALVVLAWDRVADGRARRILADDVLCRDAGTPRVCAVVAAYEAAAEDTARAVAADLAATAHRMAAARGTVDPSATDTEISALAAAIYPDARVDREDVIAGGPGARSTRVAVRVPSLASLSEADLDALIALVSAIYGALAASGVRVDTLASYLADAAGLRLEVPPPMTLVEQGSLAPAT